MVSFSDSPLVELLVAASEKPMIRPLSLLTAVSKLEAGAGGRLKEKCGAHFPLQQITIGALFKFGRTFDNTIDILLVVITDID